MASLNEQLMGGSTYIKCYFCKEFFLRLKKAVNQIIKTRGNWKCKKCTNTLKNKKSARPIGSTRISSRGYVLEKTNEGWRLQHRVIMERSIGRKLYNYELVHHLDEDKTNNAIENLEIGTWEEHTRNHHTGSKRTGLSLINIRNSAKLRLSRKKGI